MECKELEACCFDRLGSFCFSCAPIEAVDFTEVEWKALGVMLYSRSFKQLKMLVIDESFDEKLRQVVTSFRG